jgi:hypothetical protein
MSLASITRFGEELLVRRREKLLSDSARQSMAWLKEYAEYVELSELPATGAVDVCNSNVWSALEGPRIVRFHGVMLQLDEETGSGIWTIRRCNTL